MANVSNDNELSLGLCPIGWQRTVLPSAEACCRAEERCKQSYADFPLHKLSSVLSLALRVATVVRSLWGGWSLNAASERSSVLKPCLCGQASYWLGYLKRIVMARKSSGGDSMTWDDQIVCVVDLHPDGKQVLDLVR